MPINNYGKGTSATCVNQNDEGLFQVRIMPCLPGCVIGKMLMMNEGQCFSMVGYGNMKCFRSQALTLMNLEQDAPYSVGLTELSQQYPMTYYPAELMQLQQSPAPVALLQLY